MKINIYSKLVAGAWGGGNQFLKALKAEFIKQGIYADSKTEADAVIFNSYQDLWPLIKCWFINRKSKIVYRLGPVFYLHRGLKWKIIDKLVIYVANMFADLIIFQSKWSYEQALKLSFSKNKKYFIIPNAVDGEIFFQNQTVKVKTNKINLIYTSWSANPNKGFSYLNFLDKNLNFNKFQMKFIGNSPVSFKNIEILKPLPSRELADELRQADIFISPAKDDACSNAILEALACGLPVVALNSGSNGELIGKAGVLFDDNEGLLSALEVVSSDIELYKHNIVIKDIKTVSNEYLLAIKII